MIPKSLICPHCFSASAIYKERVKRWVCQNCDDLFEDPSTRKSNPQTIFLSYAHKSEKLEDYVISDDRVWLIKDELTKNGHKVWIDFEGIRGGTHWRERITDAITSHRYFLAILSNRSVRQLPKDWCNWQSTNAIFSQGH